MFRRPPPGEPSDSQVGSAPEIMHRAALADKARTKFFKDTIRLHEHSPEAVCIHWVVCSVGFVLIERDWIRDLVGFLIDVHMEIQLRHFILKSPVKCRDKLRLQ